MSLSTGLRMLLLTTLLCTAGGCGFQLRGTGSDALTVPESWRQLHLAGGNPNSEFQRELTSLFAANGVEWMDRDQATYTVELGPEQFHQRNFSLSSEARIAEFELTMSATFSVVATADGSTVMPPTTASVIRQMENDPRNVVGKTEELRLLQREMRSELARQVLHRIRFFATSDQAHTAPAVAPAPSPAPAP